MFGALFESNCNGHGLFRTSAHQPDGVNLLPRRFRSDGLINRVQWESEPVSRSQPPKTEAVWVIATR